MATITGRTGADAAFVLASHLCRLFTRYEAKLRAFTAAQVTAGTISALDAVKIYDFIDAVKAACAVLQILADNTNVVL